MARASDSAWRTALSAAMDRHADGDAAAFAEVYDALAPRLKGYFGRRGLDASGVDDLVQQTLLQMHCARQSFVRGADVVPWAFAIARRLHVDGYRRGHFERLEPAGALGESALDARPSAEAPPDEVASAQELAQLAEAELGRLPPLQREAWRLVREDGLSVEQAAAVLGTTATAVKLRAHRAYSAMRAALGLLRSSSSKGDSP